MKEYENCQNRIKGMMQIFKVQGYEEGMDILVQGTSFWGSIECWFVRSANERATL